MKITDLFKQTNLTTARNTNAQPKADTATTATPSGGAGRSGDTISISPLSRQLSQISSIIADEESAQANRVAELKARVADGSYSPSNEDVAKSIVNYTRE